MTVREEDVQLLTNNGLTKSQAYLYLSLLKSGKEDAITLSLQTVTPRTETYRLLNNLQELGLVEQQLSAPYVYEAVPIQVGTQVLLMRHLDKYNENKKKLDYLIRKYDKAEETPKEIEPRIVVNKGKQKLLQVLRTGQGAIQRRLRFHNKTMDANHRVTL